MSVPAPVEGRRTFHAAVIAAVLALVGLFALWRSSSAVDAPLRPPAVDLGPAPGAAPAGSAAVARTAEGGAADRRGTPVGGSAAEILVRGLVRDASGRGQAEVVVAWNGPGEADLEVRTAADGRFDARLTTAGTYELIARGPGILTHASSVEIDGAVRELSVELEVDSGWPLSGEVVDTDGRPIAGARITPWRRGPDGDELDPRTAAHSGPGGLFELRGLADGVTHALVEAEGYASGKARLTPRRAARVRLLHDDRRGR
jgi:hypothetical protein